jgi:hypothetical protein
MPELLFKVAVLAPPPNTAQVGKGFADPSAVELNTIVVILAETATIQDEDETITTAPKRKRSGTCGLSSTSSDDAGLCPQRSGPTFGALLSQLLDEGLIQEKC